VEGQADAIDPEEVHAGGAQGVGHRLRPIDQVV
jgi:hypothetical protein